MLVVWTILYKYVFECITILSLSLWWFIYSFVWDEDPTSMSTCHEIRTLEHTR